MLITNEYRGSVMQTPEFQAWLRQLEIEKHFKLLKTIENGEIPDDCLLNLRFFTTNQQNIHEYLVRVHKIKTHVTFLH